MGVDARGGQVKKSKYDVIFSMGAACSCSQALREAGLQFSSFPFDWLTGPDICSRAQMVADGFSGWLEPDTLLPIEAPRLSTTAWYRDTFGYCFIHDFQANVPIEEALPAFGEKYRRRVARLLRLLDGAGRALAVYIESGGSSETSGIDAAEAAHAILSKRRPGVKIDILFLKYEEGVPFKQREDESGDGWRVVRYDFKDRKEEDWRVDWRQVAKWLKNEYEVVDCRTSEEKAQWKSRARKKKYAEFKATNWWGYAVTKIQYKIYKHLRKRLSRKGIV